MFRFISDSRFLSLFFWVTTLVIVIACSKQPSGTKEKQAAHGLSADLFDINPFEVRLNGRLFRIPRGYVSTVITYSSTVIRHGHANHVSLFTYWPDFKTQSVENIRERRPRFKDQIKFYITSGVDKESLLFLEENRLEKHLKRTEWRRIEQKPTLGLVIYKAKAKGYRWGSLTYVPIDESWRTPNGNRFSLNCQNIHDTNDMPSECEASYRLKNNVHLSYYFHGKHVEHWQEIDRAIREIMTVATGVKQ
ncbi:hypothetical protein MNBD_GAMMA16-2329 [hydrothermal vent metagenome]|uniref:Lipoprotein n=1 Tax=hydrothermal vent metagenome TaxID=652676 RepID=A0A3B0YVQ0_9ZZZZ